MQERLDLLNVTVNTGNQLPPIVILLCPEDWDSLFGAGLAYIDETNKERAIDLRRQND